MRYNLDFIEETKSGIRCQGWAFDEAGKSVSLTMNTNVDFKRLERYDVQAVFEDVKVESDCGFEINIKLHFWSRNKPLFLTFSSKTEKPLTILLKVNPVIESEEEYVQMILQPKISIVIPVYNTNVVYFNELINSIKKQTYNNWELCLADGGSKDEFKEYLQTFQSEKIKVVFLSENLGIAGNTNEAIKQATGEYIAFCDHDDLLECTALEEVMKCINTHPKCDFIYTDEDKLSMDSKRFFQPNNKSDFNLRLLEVGNYLNHLSVIRTEFLDKIGLLNSEFDGSQDYDLVLRVAESTKDIYHIKKILYHWRSHADSVAENPESKLYAFENAIRALEAHFKRIGEDVQVVKSDLFGSYKVLREKI